MSVAQMSLLCHREVRPSLQAQQVTRFFLFCPSTEKRPTYLPHAPSCTHPLPPLPLVERDLASGIWHLVYHQAEAEANKEYESDVDEDERALAQAIRDRSKVIKKEVRAITREFQQTVWVVGIQLPTGTK